MQSDGAAIEGKKLEYHLLNYLPAFDLLLLNADITHSHLHYHLAFDLLL